MSGETHEKKKFIDFQLSLWHIILLVGMVVTYYAGISAFQTHVRDFEIYVHKEILRIETDLKDLETKVHPVIVDIEVLKEKIVHIDEKVESIDGKIDKLLEHAQDDK